MANNEIITTSEKLSLQIEEKMNESPEFTANTLQYYRAMADSGNAEAQYQLAVWLILETEYIEQDYPLGLEYLAKAIDQGHKAAEEFYESEIRPDDDGRYDAWA